MLKRSIQFILACAALLTAPIAMAETLRIVTLDLPPYGYVENKIDTGLNYEIGNLIAHEAGFEPDNRIIPLARAVDDIATGKADILIMFPSSQIGKIAKEIGHILNFEIIILSRAGSGNRSIADLRGKTLASVRGAKYDDRISKKNGFIIYPTKNYSQSLKMLLSRRVDAAIGPKDGLFFSAKTNAFPKQAFDDPLVLSVRKGCVFISNRTSPYIIKKVSSAIIILKENGAIKRLLRKYSL